MPFTRGQSGNPGGRPKAPVEVQEGVTSISEQRRAISKGAGNYSPPSGRILLDTVTAESPTGEG
jgi:Family of unknown function (DUF5681)